jgi:hypothetical protein
VDFEHLAFIEKWRAKAIRGSVVALDATRGSFLLTVRAGDLGETVDLRGRDATGAARKARLTIGDRVTVAIAYRAREVSAGSTPGVAGGSVAPGAVVEGRVAEAGDVVVVDCGVPVLVERETMPAAGVGDVVRFVVADEGRAYIIPTR